MLDAYKVPQTPPDLYPITYTPRSLLGVSGGIKITGERADGSSDALALREAVKAFLDRWRDMIGADLSTMSLRSVDESGDSQRMTFRQVDYQYPIAEGFGVMAVVVSLDGRLTQLDDRFIPPVELPKRPSIDRDAALKKVVGRSFTYSDVAGREQQSMVGSREEVSVRRLVVLPIEKADEIEVRLVWEVVAGTTPSWTVYIDAVTGDEVRAVQNVKT
ncbi:MAG TPA: hypothetical protein VJH03_27305 [Blastocatellia bacterium]|nr:hypothetical protein [Blastocatellia bacterium]